MPGIGTIVNVFAILAGTLLGLTVGKKIPTRIRLNAEKAIGLAIMIIGFSGALSALFELGARKDVLGMYASIILVGSLVVGTMFGEWWHIETRLKKLGLRLRSKTSSLRLGRHDDDHNMVKGFVTSSLIYAVGAMAILGAVQDGLGNPATLYLKSVLDGVTSIFLASTLGVGVAFSVIPVFVLQGSIALLAFFAGNVIPAVAILEIEAIGGVLIVAIGFNILGIKRLPVANMLPAVFIALAIGWVFA
ncbi:MAG: DUF554 domain-containing protein [Coriobacteriia bacterium]|nr:DUF554 domain-containing protein [Coriobacteriia bacterium]